MGKDVIIQLYVGGWGLLWRLESEERENEGGAYEYDAQKYPCQLNMDKLI